MPSKRGNKQKQHTTKKQKRQCIFTKDLKVEFPFLRKGLSDSCGESDVHCNTCRADFSIASGGRNDINRHLSTDKHKKAVSDIGTSSIKNFYRNETIGSQEIHLAKTEGLWAFHTVNHNQSFNSMECTSKLIKNSFEKKFSCGKTKCEAIVTNVIAPFSRDILKNELNAIPFIGTYSDASNHNAIKLFPTLIRYFHPDSGVNIKVLDLCDLPGEKAEMIHNNLVEVFEKNNVKEKVVAYCADNANTNFGGVRRQGRENVYHKLQNSLEQNIVGVGCAAHIAHNAMKAAADLLPVDIEIILIKIYGYFHIYTVRTKELKEFCEEVDVQYSKILAYSKTRFLAIMPAVESVYKIFTPLKRYFMSLEEKCPIVLKNFFSLQSAELWLMFIHNQASRFHETVLKMESNAISFVEVSKIFFDLKETFENRLAQNYVPLVIKKNLKNLVNNADINEDDFMDHIRNFYTNVIQYLNDYSNQYKDFIDFQWVTLRDSVQWHNVEPSLEYFMSKFENKIDETKCFDEVCLVLTYAKANLEKWSKKDYTTEQKWVEIFQHFKKNEISLENCLILVQYILAIPGTNTPTERVFSLINAIWTKDKSALHISTLSAMIEVKYNMGCCSDFEQVLVEHPELLKKIHSVEKYDFKNKREDTPCTE